MKRIRKSNWLLAPCLLVMTKEGVYTRSSNSELEVIIFVLKMVL